MIPPTVLVSKPTNFAMPWSSWTTAPPARSSVNEAIAAPPACGRDGLSERRLRSSRCSGRIASFSRGARKPSRSTACANVTPGSADAGLPSRKSAWTRVRL